MTGRDWNIIVNMVVASVGTVSVIMYTVVERSTQMARGSLRKCYRLAEMSWVNWVIGVHF